MKTSLVQSPSDAATKTFGLSDFDYDYPEHLVAQVPLSERTQAKLLVRSATGRIEFDSISNLAGRLPAGTLVILNNSRVIASRLEGKLKTGGRVEVFLLEPLGADEEWQAIGKPLKKLKEGTEIFFGGGEIGGISKSPNSNHPDEIQDKENTPTFHIKFKNRGGAFLEWLSIHGRTPLPPYISRSVGTSAEDELDKSRYQTVYATPEGSVAAPTAGLHYSDKLIEELKVKGIDTAFVTLHVGSGTFLPVRAENLSHHQMHGERFLIPTETIQKTLAALRDGRPIVAVGTTTFRCMEAIYRMAGERAECIFDFTNQWLRTELFFWPATPEARLNSWFASALQTNFHQPKSTLFMLISALIGLDATKAMYREAIDREFRLFSYGDSSLLWLK